MAQSDEETEEKPRRSYTRQGLEDAGASLLQALGEGFGQLFDRGRVEIEQAARTGKRHLRLHEAERERDRRLRALGRAVQRLVADGDLSHPALHEPVAQLEEAEERVAELEEALRTREGEGSDPDAAPSAP